MPFKPKTDMAKQAFSERLSRALDDKKVPARQRTGVLAKVASTSREAARKWLVGLSIPEKDNLRLLAAFLGVREEWLEYGTGLIRVANPDHPEVEELLAAMRERLLAADEARRQRLIDALRLLSE